MYNHSTVGLLISIIDSRMLNNTKFMLYNNKCVPKLLDRRYCTVLTITDTITIALIYI